jgi:hypothetical protein
MIDTATFNMMQAARPDSSVTGQSEIGPDIMSRDEPPLDDQFLLCLPKTIQGYNMITNHWSVNPYPFDAAFADCSCPANLDVSRITLVKWNTKAFDSLVLDNSAKELIFALVTNQINAERATELRGGKGNGLIILLHG